LAVRQRRAGLLGESSPVAAKRERQIVWGESYQALASELKVKAGLEILIPSQWEAPRQREMEETPNS